MENEVLKVNYEKTLCDLFTKSRVRFVSLGDLVLFYPVFTSTNFIMSSPNRNILRFPCPIRAIWSPHNAVDFDAEIYQTYLRESVSGSFDPKYQYRTSKTFPGRSFSGVRERVAKCIVIGDMAVGKTALCNRYAYENFCDFKYRATISVDFGIQKFSVLGLQLTLQVCFLPFKLFSDISRL